MTIFLWKNVIYNKSSLEKMSLLTTREVLIIKEKQRC